MNGFVHPKRTRKNLDRYVVRKAIFQALQLSLPYFQGKLLDVGCGKMPYKEFVLQHSGVKEYIGIDLETAKTYDAVIKPDVYWKGDILPFEPATFDTLMLTEVLEHCPDPVAVLKESRRVMNPTGNLFFTVPFLWPLHEVPHDAYRYTPFTLQRLFEKAGFSSVTIQSSGGWHASMASMLGLWATRGIHNKIAKNLLSFFLHPIIGFLVKKDKKIHTFSEGQMCLGFYGIAKP